MNLRRTITSFTGPALLLGALFALQGDSRSPANPGAAEILGAHVIDLDGLTHRLGVREGSTRPVALVLLSPTCPIARRYSPDLNELAEVARAAQVDFYGIFADPVATRKELREFVREYKLSFPVIYDSAGDLALRLGARVTPEAFVVNARDRFTYKGRIDDRFVGIGKLRRNITSFDLREALQRAHAEKTRSRPLITEPIGCIYEGFKQAELPKTIDFNRHIAPLVHANCAGCHRPKGVAPFELISHRDIAGRARMIGYTTRERIMPPWYARKGFGHFRDERRLSDRQIALIDRWMKNGAPAGDPADPPPAPRLPDSDWRLGKPDLVLTMRESFPVPAKGEDIYRYFVIPSNMRRDRELVAIDFKPGDPTVVHHCNFFVDYGGRAREMDRRDPGPGFSVFGKGSFMAYDGAGALGAWAPGVDPYRLPDGTGIQLPRGGDIVMEIHYHLSGKATNDRSSLALYFADKPVKRHVQGLFIGTQDLTIPAGHGDYAREVSMRVPAGMTLTDLSPHMHYLGREAQVTATLPGGRRVPLIHIEEWDLRWQNVYVFREPVYLPAGSRIDARFVFDNSDKNYTNPHDPPRLVRWGWETTDEMAEVYLTMIPDNPGDMPLLMKAAQATWRQSAEPGAPKREWTDGEVIARLRKLSGLSVWSPEGERMLETLARRVERGRLLRLSKQEATKHERQAGYQVQYASLLLVFAEYEQDRRRQHRMATAADKYIGRALQAKPGDRDARLARAVLGLYSGSRSLLREARRELEALVKECESGSGCRSYPGYARAYLYLGEYFHENAPGEARNIWRRGLKRFPDDTELKNKLGTKL